MERKGMCKNVGVCTLAGKVQVITDDDAEFKCAECGEELEAVKEEPIPEGPNPNKKWIVIAIAVILLAGIGFGAYSFFGNSEEPTPTESEQQEQTIETSETPDTTAVAQPEEIKKEEAEDNTKKEEAKQEETKEKPKKPIDPPVVRAEIEKYGTYAGSRKNGLPDGTGKVTFTKSYQLNSQYTAQPGEYIQGIFENGKPSFVTYYKNDGTVAKIKLR
jgi:outer membrane biosynthesis protein TonB